MSSAVLQQVFMWIGIQAGFIQKVKSNSRTFAGECSVPQAVFLPSAWQTVALCCSCYKAEVSLAQLWWQVINSVSSMTSPQLWWQVINSVSSMTLPQLWWQVINLVSSMTSPQLWWQVINLVSSMTSPQLWWQVINSVSSMTSPSSSRSLAVRLSISIVHFCFWHSTLPSLFQADCAVTVRHSTNLVVWLSTWTWSSHQLMRSGR